VSRVLVTGASGFIGRRALAPLLEAGFEVHATARGTSPPDGRAVTWHAADLLDAGQRRAVVERVRASHLLHLAWCGAPVWEAPENAAWAVATADLLEDFAARGGTRAVFAGTCAEYAWGGSQPLREDAPLEPATLYGVCKNAARRVVQELGERRGVCVAWGRVFHVYGPGEDPRRLVAGIARALLAGERAATSPGEQVRDFLHVDDVGAAFAALVAAEVGGAVNIASGEGVSVRRVAELVALAAGRPELLDVGALAPRPGDPAYLVADATRLREEAGFVAGRTLDEGLAATVAWWRDQARR
jgi:nucleoside-diphosphate-sugar epimerase